MTDANRRDFYSIVQYQPSRDRAEGCNIGVLLVSPTRNLVLARFSENNELVRQRFGPNGFNERSLSIAKKALSASIPKLEPTREAFEQWRAPMANRITVLPARGIALDDPATALAALFNDLVGETVPKAHRAHRRAPRLDDIFMPLFSRHLVERQQTVPIPELDKPLRDVFRFENGRPHFVKPYAFTAAGALTSAAQLGVQGHMLDRHHGSSLLVVGNFPNEEALVRVRSLLRDFSVTTYSDTQDDLAALQERIVRDAHALS